MIMSFVAKLWRNGKYKGLLTDGDGDVLVFKTEQEAETGVGIEMTQMEFAEGKWTWKIVNTQKLR